MASLTVDTFPTYNLRKDRLLTYLTSLFPESSSVISVEVCGDGTYEAVGPDLPGVHWLTTALERRKR